MSAELESNPAKPTREILLWLGLVLAFSPVLTDLAGHLVENPWARSCLMAPVMILIAQHRLAGRDATHKDGYLLALIGILIGFVFTIAEPLRFARLGLPIAVLGLARATGRPTLPIAVLAFWLIPLPSLAIESLGDRLLSLQLEIANTIAGGALRIQPLLETGYAVASPVAAIPLRPAQSGLPLLYWFIALGWYASLLEPSQPASLIRSLKRSSLFGLLALPVQTIMVVLVCLSLDYTGPRAAAFALDTLPWSVATLLVFGLVERQRWRASREISESSEQALEAEEGSSQCP